MTVQTKPLVSVITSTYNRFGSLLQGRGMPEPYEGDCKK